VAGGDIRSGSIISGAISSGNIGSGSIGAWFSTRFGTMSGNIATGAIYRPRIDEQPALPAPPGQDIAGFRELIQRTIGDRMIENAIMK
jgi:acetyl-CoA carboxylase carboxyltransferase component